MNLSLETPNRRAPAMVSISAQAKRPVRRDDAAAAAHAFADRLLYTGWMEDNQRDRMKLQMIRAIVEWAHGNARN